MKRILVLAMAAALLGGCATTYAPESFSGGFSEKDLGGDIWQVRFGGNGYTTQETVQTYWLYHCSELALSKGYAGFQIVTPMALSEIRALQPVADGSPIVIKASHGGGGGHVVVYGGGGGGAMYKPAMAGQIRMLKGPVVQAPGRTFDAAKLKTMLEPYVTGPKCGGNVCPHVHRYLFPEILPTTPS